MARKVAVGTKSHECTSSCDVKLACGQGASGGEITHHSARKTIFYFVLLCKDFV